MVNFKNMNVLVIGDIALDIIEEGISTRLSPEAPVPIILNPTTSYSLGMAGNVIANILNLGATACSTVIYGEDEYGKVLLNLLDKMYSESGYLLKIYNGDTENTTVKKRIIANGGQLARIDYEDNIGQQDIENLIDALNERVIDKIKYDLIIISDYNKGIITKQSWRKIKPLLLKLSDNFFVDTKKKNVLDFYEGMYIFPNRQEMKEIMKYNNCITRNELREEMDLDFIIETASEEGAFLYKNDGKIYHCPTFKSNVADVTGCGDTFVAAFALFYTKYNNKKAALGFANYCCSKVVQKKGTAPINIEEVDDFDITGI